MAEKCIFCGKVVTFFSKTALPCGGADQPVCSECAEKYSRESPLQRARLALDTGRAREPGKLTEFIEAEEKRLEEGEKRKKARAEQLQKAKEGRRESTRCCGFDMVREGEYTFTDQTPFALRMLPLYTPTMVMFRCEVCGQIKLFDAAFFPPEEGGTEPERAPEPDEEPVTCPVCGKEHSPRIGCPRCAMKSGLERQTACVPKQKRDQKPPWEK